MVMAVPLMDMVDKADKDTDKANLLDIQDILLEDHRITIQVRTKVQLYHISV